MKQTSLSNTGHSLHCSILAAVNDPGVRSLISRELEEDALLFVDDASCLTAALDEGEGSYDLLLLSSALPGLTAETADRIIGGSAARPSLPVIVLGTDRAQEGIFLSAGAMDFMLPDSCTGGVLKARIRLALELFGNQHMLQSAERDPLTGLYSKEFFFHCAGLADAESPDREMDAAALDISHFHVVNEHYGRLYGDRVLRQMGENISRAAEQMKGIACRRDGDIFLLYFPHTDEYEGILASVSEGLDRQIRLRMGVYPRSDKSLDIDRRFDRAKLALDSIRHSFTKTVAVYDDSLFQSELHLERLLDDFPAAIAEKQFVVYYQPQFIIQDISPVLRGAEALVRWMHPQLGLINPGEFISLFELNGLIQQLDQYVWREVAAQMRDWKQRLDFCLPVSVNVSRIDLFDRGLLGLLKGLLAEYGLSPEEFHLEITESAYTQDSEQIISMVAALRAEGFHVEIDDFGSGYSSLNMISNVPLDALKLDMGFMQNAFKDRRNAKMLDAVIGIASSLEVPSIAEGVETAEQMFVLKEMGCDMVQGYYFSRPVPPEIYEQFLLDRKYALLTGGAGSSRGDFIKAPEQFAYEALHDPVTGLYNRSAYKILLKDADQRNIALLLAEVDDYEEIRSLRGDEAANRIMLRLANVLRHSFRSVDFVCRIEEAVFAVIMTRVNSSMHASLVARKVQDIRRMLREDAEALPPFTLNIGAAFADRKESGGDLYQNATLALERAKVTEDHWSAC